MPRATSAALSSLHARTRNKTKGSRLSLIVPLRSALLFVALLNAGCDFPPAVERRATTANMPGFEFNRETAERLSPERRAQLDIEFFNEFWVKGDSGPDNPASVRAAKIHAMAEEGFEVAYLADKLYRFGTYGNPSFRPDYVRYWERLKQLAEAGDPSAQCLFAHTAAEYRSFGQDPPTRSDREVLAPSFRKAAAERGHPYCLGLMSGEAFQNKDYGRAIEILLRCANAGVSLCQNNLAGVYSSGVLGLPRDRVKGLCWMVKARNGNKALSIESGFRNMRALLWDEIGEEGLARVLSSITPDTDCETVKVE